MMRDDVGGRILRRAVEALGGTGRAQRWIERPNHALGGRRPIDAAAEADGVRRVERILGRIEHGVYR